MVSVFNLGSIKTMAIPAIWKSLPLEHSSSRTPDQVSQPYALKEDETVRFILFYRGKQVYPDIASDFLNVLKEPPHELDTREYASIEVVLRHMSEDDFFAREFVRTESINGKTVLTAQGIWKESGLKNLGVFINGNADGSLIDELHYYAPQEKFDRFLPAAKEILASLKFAKGEQVG